MLDWSLLIACLAFSLAVATLAVVVRHLRVVKEQQRIMQELLKYELRILQNHGDMLKAQLARRPDLAIEVERGGKMQLEFLATGPGTPLTSSQGMPPAVPKKGLDKVVRRADEPFRKADAGPS